MPSSTPALRSSGASRSRRRLPCCAAPRAVPPLLTALALGLGPSGPLAARSGGDSLALAMLKLEVEQDWRSRRRACSCGTPAAPLRALWLIDAGGSGVSPAGRGISV